LIILLFWFPLRGISSALLALVPILSHLFSLFVIPFSLTLTAVFLALVLVFPAAVVLGAIFPILATAATRGEENTGAIYGAISGASSLGSILGVFLTGFFLISFFGTKNILFILAVVMGILAALLAFFSSKTSKESKIILKISLAITFLLYIASTVILVKPSTLLYSGDSNYYHIRVMDLSIKELNDARTLILDADTHSYATKEVMEELYSNVFPVLGILAEKNEKALFIGSGAYSMPILFAQANPETQVTVSEIDPALKSIGERFFNLDSERIPTVAGDGRIFLSKTPDSYDVIFGDAYNSFISVPWHLLTREYYALVKKRLNPHGIYGMSFVSTQGKSGEDMTQSVLSTFKEAFPNYIAFAFGEKNDKPQNIVLIAKNDNIPIDAEELKKALSKDKIFSYLSEKIIPLEAHSSALVLTDDYAPVEKLMKPILASYLPIYRRAYSNFLNEGL
jgi:spermidine synthase